MSQAQPSQLAEWTCPKCQRTIKGKLVLPIRCCEVVEPVKVCQHRGPSAGKASCGCGTVWHCERLGGYCGDRDVVEFATIGEDVLTGQNYRRCSGCSEFSSRQTETPKAVPSVDTSGK